ncbi:MAG: Rrf2 family transcriptional regulator [Actinomycetota bacterium]
MRLSARSEYGLLALVDLATAPDGAPLASRELSSARGLPPAFLDQLLADLRRAGIVRATRGARGGFALARDASAITALEIVEALEGPVAPSVCTPDMCGREGGCAAETVWSSVAAAVRDALSGFTLAELASEQALLDRAPLTCTPRRSE